LTAITHAQQTSEKAEAAGPRAGKDMSDLNVTESPRTKPQERSVIATEKIADQPSCGSRKNSIYERLATAPPGFPIQHTRPARC
jgi:hypothetical protein